MFGKKFAQATDKYGADFMKSEPLYKAAESGDLAEAKKLIAKGAKPDVVDG